MTIGSVLFSINSERYNIHFIQKKNKNTFAFHSKFFYHTSTIITRTRIEPTPYTLQLEISSKA